MDFTTSGAPGPPGKLGGERLSLGATGGTLSGGPTVSFFADLPNPHSVREDAGPVLVMPPKETGRRRGVWAQRVWLLVFVLFCLEVGIILTWCPWTKLWNENSILLSYPRLRDFLMLGFVRGVISGLGLINIWMGISEAIRYREGQDS